MTYPSKGAWLFHNVTRDFDFWPTLESITIIEAQPLDLATFTCSVVDVANAITFDNEDEVWVKFRGTRIFAGHVKSLEESQTSELGARQYNLGAQDYTAKLDDSVIDHTADRAGEPLADRIDWILSFLNYPITAGSLDLPSEDCEPANFDGQTVREALSAECDEHRLSLYVDHGKDLHLFRTEVVTAPFALDDLHPDYSSSFPYAEYSRTRDSVDLATAAYVQGDKPAINDWVTDAGAIVTYGRQERAVNDSNLRNATQVGRAGARALAEQSKPIIDGSLVCWEPGLQGGMTASLSNDRWELDAITIILTGVTITAMDPHDDEGKALLRSEVEFSDRRKARGSHRDVTNRLTRRRIRPEDVPPAAVAELCDADTMVLVPTHNAQQGTFSAFAYGVGSPPNLTDALDHVTTSAQNGCPSGLGGFGPGGTRKEVWYPTGLSSIGADWIDILITFDPVAAGDIIGVATDAIVGVAWATPTGMGQYTPLGTIGLASGGTVSIPRSMIELGMFVVLAPAWYHNDNAFYCAEDLSFPTLGPAHGGEANSGDSGAPDASSVARVFCGDGYSGWVSGAGLVDGSNKEFQLLSWSGIGQVEARIGAIILAADDFTVDAGAGTVTLNMAPPARSDTRFRYQVAL